MNKDFGTAFHKNNGNAVKVTVNEFRENLYLHIREYAMDGDTGQWFPTKSGFALPADEVCSLLPLLEEAAAEVSKRFVYTTQIEFEFGEQYERYRSVISKLVQLKIYEKPEIDEADKGQTVKVMLRDLENLLEIQVEGTNLNKKENLFKLLTAIKDVVNV